MRKEWYRYLMMVPRFPYLWPVNDVVADTPKIYLDTNRCVQCLRCNRDIKTADGKHIFQVKERGGKTVINIDKELAATMSEELAMKAMNQCPVGCILRKEVGYRVPIGQRKFDTKPIGSEIEG
jgi:[NiFe] hydrogenase diaphorase moiety small subunit